MNTVQSWTKYFILEYIIMIKKCEQFKIPFYFAFDLLDKRPFETK